MSVELSPIARPMVSDSAQGRGASRTPAGGFEFGITTMRGRNTRIFGSHGEFMTDSQVITIDDFRTGERRVVDTAVGTDDGAAGGHGGGDGALVSAFTAALPAGDPSLVPTTAEESLQSHLMVFAAERARREGTVEAVPQR